MYHEILLSIEDKVATITINRPDISNAIPLRGFHEIRDALEKCGADDSVGAIILTGAGKNFSAGGNIKEFKGLIESEVYLDDASVTSAGKMSTAVRRCPKPVIAMVNGAAAGAGCSLCLACDFRIMTERSRLIMAFISVALPGDTGGIYFLQRLVGLGKTTEMMMTGAPMDGKEALALGVANKLVAEDQLEEATYKFARKLANMPLLAIAKQKAMFNEFFFPELDKFTVRESEYMQFCSRSADFEEAVDAFLGKRAPQFAGK